MGNTCYACVQRGSPDSSSIRAIRLGSIPSANSPASRPPAAAYFCASPSKINVAFARAGGWPWRERCNETLPGVTVGNGPASFRRCNWLPLASNTRQTVGSPVPQRSPVSRYCSLCSVTGISRVWLPTLRRGFAKVPPISFKASIRPSRSSTFLPSGGSITARVTPTMLASGRSCRPRLSQPK